MTIRFSALFAAAVLAISATVSVAPVYAADAAAAPAASAAAPAAAEVAAPAAAPMDAAAPVKEVIDNPYGLDALWKTGDFVAKGTLIIMFIMSMGSWY
ncbi:MotA/TolQ/ExbB proton channel family protein, partial [Undibacterium sp. CCC1.1]|nr:MotA/TolQ/ExbB proton channel family protein [Undibacterium sp. CCC1.1]MEB0178282.1 MotA/TolQ/ExbB proton channel family protein [Undibacterium sp. CCC3.4]